MLVLEDNMDYTKEQVDEMITNAVKEATKGLYTKDDFDRELTREVDRRVETGIQKGLETHKRKWEDEYTRRAQMTAEELAQKELQEKMGELTAKEREVLRRQNHLNAKELLTDAGIPKEHYEKFIDVLVLEDSDATAQKVQNFVEMFNNTKMDIESRIKSEFSRVPAPTQSQSEGGLTKEQFIRLPYEKKLELKNTQPEIYNSLIK